MWMLRNASQKNVFNFIDNSFINWMWDSNLFIIDMIIYIIIKLMNNDKIELK